ncbi:inhibin beta B chain-like [Asterias rubens]|uniref:inhibin beta B chain-like n=1 Tax=Asterias rubens TaxID=7604 RepID=UPI0014551982|nr:inhibin beta B chain-like [Asterias rubens]
MAVLSWQVIAFVLINCIILATNFAHGGILSSTSPELAPVSNTSIESVNITNPDEHANQMTTRLFVGQTAPVDGVESAAEEGVPPPKRAGQYNLNSSPKDSGEKSHGKHKAAGQSKAESVSTSESTDPPSNPFLIGEKERIARLEMFKESFLQKLGLKAPPNVTQPKPNLPSVVLSRLLNREQNDQPRLQDTKPRKVVVFAEEGEVVCGVDVDDSSCFKFDVTDALDNSVVSSALIWVYITHAPEGSSVVISRPKHHYGNGRVLVTRKLYSQEGWVEVEIPLERHKWNRQQHYFVVTTKPTHEIGNRTVSRESSLRPMLMMTLTRKEWSHRTRRSTGLCTANQTSCCVKDFMADFRLIGWSSWIIRPLEFNVRYCTGSCGAATRNYLSDHAEVVSLHIENNAGGTDMAMCCVPKDISGMEVIYLENNSVHTTTINVIVETCGCA